METTISQIIYGFSIACEPMNLFYCFVGCIAGTMVGVLPGLGPTAALSMLLPVTFGIPPAGSIIMMAGIYYGAQYGGSTTSILVNIPGEAGSVITCLDGYQMARKGRAGAALGMAAFASFIAGTFGVLALSFIAPPLTDAALRFGYPEYFALMCLGLTILTFLAHGSMLKALMTAMIGLFIGTIGMDTMTGFPRFTFESPSLMEGVGVVPIAMGMFGITEILCNIEKQVGKVEVLKTKIPLRELFPNLKDWKDSAVAIIQGSSIGFLLGVLPGGGAIIASFSAYAIQKKISKHPELFGTGVVEGVAAPEAANNGAAQGAMIPMLTLGIPSNVVMALLLGALLIHGITPGPLLMSGHPDIFWGVVCSMYIGNIALLVLNLPLIPLWVQCTKVPYPILFPLIFLFCLIGIYTINNGVFEIFSMIFFGILGYLFRKLDFEAAPLILAVVLGPMMEKALRQSLIMSSGDMTVFFRRPLSATLIAVAILLLVAPLFPKIGKVKELPKVDD